MASAVFLRACKLVQCSGLLFAYEVDGVVVKNVSIGCNKVLRSRQSKLPPSLAQQKETHGAEFHSVSRTDVGNKNR
jgi:hypothetical protein